MATQLQNHDTHDHQALVWTVIALLAIVILAYTAYEMYPPAAEYRIDLRTPVTSMDE